MLRSIAHLKCVFNYLASFPPSLKKDLFHILHCIKYKSLKTGADKRQEDKSPVIYLFIYKSKLYSTFKKNFFFLSQQASSMKTSIQSSSITGFAWGGRRNQEFRRWDASLDGHSPSPGSSWSSSHSRLSSSSLPAELYFWRHPHLRKDGKQGKNTGLSCGYFICRIIRNKELLYLNVLSRKIVSLDLVVPHSGLLVFCCKTAGEKKTDLSQFMRNPENSK